MLKLISYKKRMVHIGVRHNPCGRTENYYAPVSHLNGYMDARVEFYGYPQIMYFKNFRGRMRVVNWQATAMFGHKGFFIYGPAVVLENIEKWHCLRVCGSKSNIDAKIAHLTLKDEYAVVPTSRRGDHHDVIARDEADIILLKMSL